MIPTGHRQLRPYATLQNPRPGNGPSLSGCRCSPRGNNLTQDLQGAFASCPVHIQVGNHANALRIRSVCQDAVHRQQLRDFITCQARLANVKKQDVGDYLGGVNLDSRNLRQLLSQEFGVGVVDMESLGALLQRNQAGGG